MRPCGLLFLDRDGVLNRKARDGDYITKGEDLVLLPGAAAALKALRDRYPAVPVVVVTNQRGVALGRMTQADLDAVHRRLLEELRERGADVTSIEVCTHEIGKCDCRKPATGMLLRALRRWPGATGERSIMIGDSAEDILAANRIGAKSCLVGPPQRRNEQLARADLLGATPHAVADSLALALSLTRVDGWVADLVGC